jgi:2'-5' RNA ligase
MGTIRAFVAVDISDPGVVEKIAGVQAEILRLGLDVKLVERESLHITLRFLGEIPQSRINDIVRALSSVKFGRFRITLAGIGAFPDASRPRVVWVGVSQGAGELIRLAGVVREAVDKYAEHQEGREFVPHATIGRLKSGRNADRLREVIARYRDAEFGTVLVDSIKLKRSVLTPRGPVYSDIFVHPLT